MLKEMPKLKSLGCGLSSHVNTVAFLVIAQSIVKVVMIYLMEGVLTQSYLLMLLDLSLPDGWIDHGFR